MPRIDATDLLPDDVRTITSIDGFAASAARR